MDTTVTFGPEVAQFLEGYPRRPLEEYEPITVKLFSDLDPVKEEEFRAYARKTYTAADPINPVFHPVVQDEMRKMGCK